MRIHLAAFIIPLVFCGTAIASAMTNSGAYLHDGDGKPVRSSSNLCWHTGDWSPADAVTGCDGELTPPIGKPAAPDFLPTPGGASAVSPLIPSAAKRCDFRIAVNSDSSFGFGQDHLSAIEKRRLLAEFRQKVTTCWLIESIVVSAHTDRLGKASDNQKLSERRAVLLAAEIGRIAGTTLIEIKGFGSAQPITQCAKQRRKINLIRCLAPDRRATIDVRGIAN